MRRGRAAATQHCADSEPGQTRHPGNGSWVRPRGIAVRGRGRGAGGGAAGARASGRRDNTTVQGIRACAGARTSHACHARTTRLRSPAAWMDPPARQGDGALAGSMMGQGRWCGRVWRRRPRTRRRRRRWGLRTHAARGRAARGGGVVEQVRDPLCADGGFLASACAPPACRRPCRHRRRLEQHKHNRHQEHAACTGLPLVMVAPCASRGDRIAGLRWPRK